MVFRQLDWESKGIRIDGEYLNNLRFADDVVLFANTYEELRIMMVEMVSESKKVGLQINLDKTRVMSNNFACDDIKILVEGQEIKKVEEYVYLGQLITGDGQKEKEVKRRITLGWKAFGRANMIFKSKQLAIIHKRKFYNRCILPTVCYGAETWALTKKQTLKLRSMQRAQERIMLHISLKEHQTAEAIRRTTKLEDVIAKVAEQKWSWAGHVMRRKDERWSQKLTVWTPRWKRARGRPKVRWVDDLNEFRKRWQRNTNDRNYWKDQRRHFSKFCLGKTLSNDGHIIG